MDALSDPRAFLSAQEKRAAQMKAMGIEESDIQTQGLALGGKECNSTKKDDEKRDEFKWEPITPESLKGEKNFQKVIKKQQKELEGVRKRQHKESLGIQKQQCLAVFKVVKMCKRQVIRTTFLCASLLLTNRCHHCQLRACVSSVWFFGGKQI